MISYLKGDATEPVINKGTRIIAHVCNDIDVWGAGFVMAISNKWPHAEQAYHEWHESDIPGSQFKLGNMRLILVEDSDNPIFVANMIAQHETRKTQIHPLDYSALAECLATLAVWTWSYNGSIHMPRIGCGLAGGNWNVVEPLIDFYLKEHDVYVYDLEV